MECIFCKIIKGEIPAAKIYEDEDYLAFLDINPANKGHTLIVPKEHYATIYEMPPGTLERLGPIVQKIAQQIKNQLNAEGLNILMNNEKPAGQEIFHAHIHLIPRYENDEIKLFLPHKQYKENELEEYAKKLTIKDTLTEGLAEAKVLEEDQLLPQEEIQAMDEELKEEEQALKTMLKEENEKKDE